MTSRHFRLRIERLMSNSIIPVCSDSTEVIDGRF